MCAIVILWKRFVAPFIIYVALPLYLKKCQHFLANHYMDKANNLLHIYNCKISICQYFHSKLFIWSVKYLWLFKNLRTIFRFQIKYGRSCMRTFSPSVHFIATRHLWQLWIIRLCNFIFYWSQNIDDCDGFAKKWEQNPAIFIHIWNISILWHEHYI